MRTNTPMTLWQRAGLETLWALCCGFALLPYWFRYYVVENIVFFILFCCLRYRMKVVVTENLRNSLPREERGRAPAHPPAVLPHAGRNLRRYGVARRREEVAPHDPLRQCRGPQPRHGGPRLDRPDGPLRMLGVRLVLGHVRTLAGGGGGSPPSAAQHGDGGALPAAATTPQYDDRDHGRACASTCATATAASRARTWSWASSPTRIPRAAPTATGSASSTRTRSSSTGRKTGAQMPPAGLLRTHGPRAQGLYEMSFGVHLRRRGGGGRNTRSRSVTCASSGIDDPRTARIVDVVPSEMETQTRMTAEIVILNWNGRDHLRTFLPRWWPRRPQGGVTVADNGSTDDSAEGARARVPHGARVVRLGRNYGFAEGTTVRCARWMRSASCC